jgi:integrase
MKVRRTHLPMMTKRPNGSGSIYQRGNVWWIQYCRNGKPYAESSKSRDRGEAERLLHQRLGEIATDRFQGPASRWVTISQLCDLVIEDYKFRKLRSLKDVEWRTEKHLRVLIGGLRASEFGAAQVKSYASSRRSQGASDATVNRELAIVRRGFSLAMQADQPLVARVPFIRKLDEDNARQRFLEHSQYLRLRDALPGHLKAIFVVAYHVGLRIGELRKVEWSQVDLTAGEIRLEKKQTKGKKPRTLPIYGEMRPWLEMQKAERDQKWPDCRWVFHYLDRPIGSHVKGFVDACKAASLPNLRFHDLRRSAIRNMERAGISRKTAMEYSGRRTESVYRRYDIVSAQDMKRAAVTMENYIEGLNQASVTAVVTTVQEKPN